MRNDYETLFSHLKAPEPSAQFFPRVIRRIAQQERRAIMRTRVISSLGMMLSLVGLVLASRMVHQGITESGFSEFFSLLFSDAGTIAVYWKSMGLALLESLPVAGVIALLGTLLVFLKSIATLASGTRDPRVGVSYP